MEINNFDGIEIDGRNVKNIVDAFKLFPELGLRSFRRGVIHGPVRQPVEGAARWGRIRMALALA